MRIALLSRWFWEERLRAGGPSAKQGGTVEQLALAVAARGHEIVVLSQSKEVRELTRSDIGGLEVWLTPRFRKPRATAMADKALKLLFGHRKLVSDARDLHQFLRERGPFDVLWAQCEEPDGLVTAVAATTGKLPPILTQIFALRYDFDAQGQPLFRQRRTLRLALRTAKVIAANSPMTAALLQQQYRIKKERITFLPHNLTRTFLDAAEALPPSRLAPRLDRPPDPPRILFLGALNAKKGVIDFVEAAAHCRVLEPETRDWNWIMVGGTTDDKDVDFKDRLHNKILQAQLGERLLQLGAIPAERVRAEIRAATVVVLPSLLDEFSRALAEVLALGKPAVVTTTTGACYLLERDGSGLLVPPANPSALATAIRRVVREYPFRERAEAAARRIRHELSPETLAPQVVELLERVRRAE